MKVRALMTSDPYTLPADATLADAVEPMSRHGIRHLPIVDEGRVLGIISDRDLKMALGPEAETLNLDEIDPRQASAQVTWFMAETVVAVDADAEVGEACRVFVEAKIGALPVIEAGSLVGIVSVLDIVRAAGPLFDAR